MSTVMGDADATPPREEAAVRGALANQAPGPRHWWQGRAARRLFRHRLAMAGLVVLLLMCAMAAFSPLITGTDPNHGDLRLVRKPPQDGHWLGTDGAGRD